MFLQLKKLLAAQPDFLHAIIYKNSVGTWLTYLLSCTLLVFMLCKLKSYALCKLKKTAEASSATWDDELLEVLKRTSNVLVCGMVFSLALNFLELGKKGASGVKITFLCFAFLQILLWIDSIGQIIVRRTMKSEIASHGDLASPKAIILSFLIRFFLYVVVLLMFLDNLGVNITALVTGLGIGGIAIALAVQNILGDLFASLSIALDKPFEVGDFVAVGDVAGNVQKVGLKTTRIKSVNGEQIVFPNADLLQSRLRNFKRMTERRVVFTFGLEYSTPPEKLDSMREIVKKVIEEVPGTRFERVHLIRFGSASLDFETVYFVLSPDYIKFADIHHIVLRELLRRSKEHEVVFAFPTQTLHFGDKFLPPIANRIN